MKPAIPFLFAALAATLAACGADTMGTAATGAALKKTELEQGKKTLGQAQQKIDAAVVQMNQSAQRAADDGVK